MDQISLEVNARNIGSNSVIHHLREEGYIPGVLYGNNLFNQTIQVNKKDLKKQIKTHGKSAIFTITVDQDQVPVKINEVQKDVISGEIIHVDLQRVDMDKIVVMTVPIHLFGQAVGVKSGGTIQQQVRDLEVRALPALVPESIHVNVSDIHIGGAIYVRDIDVPEELQVLNDLDAVVLTILPPKMSDIELDNEEPKSEPEIVNARDGRGIDAAK